MAVRSGDLDPDPLRARWQSGHQFRNEVATRAGAGRGGAGGPARRCHGFTRRAP
jgi:hypothetical protein